MAIKKKYDVLYKEIKIFETTEMKKAKEAYERRTELRFGDELTEFLEIIAQKKYTDRPGYLANLFLSYRDFCQNTSKEERDSIEGIQVKYGLLLENVIKDQRIWENPWGETKYLERETAILLMEQSEQNRSQFTDLYNGVQLVETQQENIRYCPLWKKWLIWDGVRWGKAESNGIFPLAVETIRGFSKRAVESGNKTDALALMEHALRSESCRKIEAMVRAATWDTRIWIQPEDLDKDNFLLNCRNGMIDLKTNRFFEHDPGKMISKLANVEYDEKAVCHNWRQFLKDIFEENRSLIHFVQKVCGWTLTGDLSNQAMFILYGTGANGKSTFINTIMNILGDYAASSPAETFMERKGDQANNDVARLMGIRFVSAMETDSGGRLAESVIKRLTGNDLISARFLYGEFFDFYPTFKIFMATNHKPRITGVDNGIWRRIRLIPFTVSIPEEKQNRHLQEILNKEKSGILNWMLDGCMEWQKEGLGEPPQVKEATTLYRNQMSAIETFLDDCTERSSLGMIKASDLYKVYLSWCEENHERPMSARAFYMKMDDTGIDKVRQSKGVHYLEIDLLQ